MGPGVIRDPPSSAERAQPRPPGAHWDACDANGTQSGESHPKPGSSVPCAKRSGRLPKKDGSYGCCQRRTPEFDAAADAQPRCRVAGAASLSCQRGEIHCLC